MRSRPPHIHKASGEREKNRAQREKKFGLSIAVTLTEALLQLPFCYFATPNCLHR